MAITSVPTASQRASAAQRLAERDRWAYARNAATGRAFIAMPGSRGSTYYVARDGSACTCEGSRRYPVCSHQLAAREAAEQALAPRPRPSYDDLFPVCADERCDDAPARGSAYCRRHDLADAF